MRNVFVLVTIYNLKTSKTDLKKKKECQIRTNYRLIYKITNKIIGFKCI